MFNGDARGSGSFGHLSQMFQRKQMDVLGIVVGNGRDAEQDEPPRTADGIPQSCQRIGHMFQHLEQCHEVERLLSEGHLLGVHAGNRQPRNAAGADCRNIRGTAIAELD